MFKCSFYHKKALHYSKSQLMRCQESVCVHVIYQKEFSSVVVFLVRAYWFWKPPQVLFTMGQEMWATELGWNKGGRKKWLPPMEKRSMVHSLGCVEVVPVNELVLQLFAVSTRGLGLLHIVWVCMCYCVHYLFFFFSQVHFVCTYRRKGFPLYLISIKTQVWLSLLAHKKGKEGGWK